MGEFTALAGGMSLTVFERLLLVEDALNVFGREVSRVEFVWPVPATRRPLIHVLTRLQERRNRAVQADLIDKYRFIPGKYLP